MKKLIVGLFVGLFLLTGFLHATPPPASVQVWMSDYHRVDVNGIVGGNFFVHTWESIQNNYGGTIDYVETLTEYAVQGGILSSQISYSPFTRYADDFSFSYNYGQGLPYKDSWGESSFHVVNNTQNGVYVEIHITAQRINTSGNVIGVYNKNLVNFVPANSGITVADEVTENYRNGTWSWTSYVP